MSEKGPLATFDEATRRVTEDRGAIYGHPADDFARVMHMGEVIEQCDDVELKHVMRMICVKLCRLVVTPWHMDSWVDIAGYARTAAMILDRRSEDVGYPVHAARCMAVDEDCPTPTVCRAQGCQRARNR